MITDFFKDSTVFEQHLKKLLPLDEKVQKQFAADLLWFQQEYQKGKNSKYFSGASRDNGNVINAFGAYLKRKGFSKNDFICDVYSQINIPRIIKKLNEIYLQQ